MPQISDDQDLLSGMPDWLVESHDIDPRLKKKAGEPKKCQKCGEIYPPESFNGGGVNCNKCRSRSGVRGRKFKSLIKREGTVGNEKADEEYKHLGRCSICKKMRLCRVCIVTNKYKCRDHGGVNQKGK